MGLWTTISCKLPKDPDKLQELQLAIKVMIALKDNTGWARWECSEPYYEIEKELVHIRGNELFERDFEDELQTVCELLEIDMLEIVASKTQSAVDILFGTHE